MSFWHARKLSAMRWNYQERISQDRLWDLGPREGDHGVAGIRTGVVQEVWALRDCEASWPT